MCRRELYFVIVVALAVVVMLLLPTGYENPSLTQNVLYEKAKVVDVDNSGVNSISIVTIGTQKLKLKLLSGEFKGEDVTAINELLGDKKRDKIFEVDDKVLSIVRLNDAHDQIVEVRAEEYYRADLELFLLVLFVMALIFFTGKTGMKAAISFVFTALSFWKILIPALLQGYNPLYVSMSLVFVVTSIIILLVGGVSKKGVVALLGSVSGVITTALLALLFGCFFKIPGAIQEYSDALMYAGFSHLNFSDMFISSIFISSAGAVMDVAMDIAASQDELCHKAPYLSRRELIRSGLNIASPIIGSMTTTLLFAYSGSFLLAFMAFMAQGVPMISIVNRGFISAEILHTMVGSFGLVLVAPITAIIGGWVYKYKSNRY